MTLLEQFDADSQEIARLTQRVTELETERKRHLPIIEAARLWSDADIERSEQFVHGTTEQYAYHLSQYEKSAAQLHAALSVLEAQEGNDK